MKNVNATLLAFVAFLIPFNCFAMNLLAHCKANASLNDAEFLEQFPYDAYVQDKMADPLGTLLNDRTILKSEGRSEIMDNVFYEASEYNLKANPIDVTNLSALKAQLRIAEQFLTYPETAEPALVFITHSIGDRFMGAASYRIEEGFAAGQVDKASDEFAAVLEILTRNKFTPNIPATNSEKFWSHAQKGDWAYIWDRFKTRYLKDTILVFSLALNLLHLIWRIFRYIRRKSQTTSKQFIFPNSHIGNH